MGAPADVVSFGNDSATNFICNNSDPIWYNQEGLMFPECSGKVCIYVNANSEFRGEYFAVTSIPTDVEQDGSISLQPKPGVDVCNNTKQLNEVCLQN